MVVFLSLARNLGCLGGKVGLTAKSLPSAIASLPHSPRPHNTRFLPNQCTKMSASNPSVDVDMTVDAHAHAAAAAAPPRSQSLSPSPSSGQSTADMNAILLVPTHRSLTNRFV